MSRKIVVCGAGFLGSYVAKELGRDSRNVIHLASRGPARLDKQLRSDPSSPFVTTSNSSTAGWLGEPSNIDITQTWEHLVPEFEQADVVVSLVGILNGSPAQFERIQLRGAKNVARAAQEVGARLVHVSAIGANEKSKLPYFRTKGLAEKAIFNEIPSATILRPSLVFGPGDGFFARFATLSRFLPFMPVFGGGTSRFQPVYAGDIARFVSLCVNAGDESDSSGSRRQREARRTVREAVEGRIFECGGPNVFTYREMMRLVLQYTHRTRPVISLPWAVGKMQGWALEKLPENILTLSRDQVEQLKMDNVAYSDALIGSEYAGKPPPSSPSSPSDAITNPASPGFAHLLAQFGTLPPELQNESEPAPVYANPYMTPHDPRRAAKASQVGPEPAALGLGVTSVHDILPTYL